MTTKEELSTKDCKIALPKYELVPPDGGWGFVIALGIIFAFTATIIPQAGFGIMYTPFLERFGEVTSYTTFINSVFFAVFCFTGLPANHLLQRLSYRKVGLLGAVLFFIGAVGITFGTTLFHLTVSFGVMQALGSGFLMPATLTAFNYYFKKRSHVVMSITQTILAFNTIFVPALLQNLMDVYGFRGTAAIMAAISLNAIPSVAVLHPVKWHAKRIRILYNEIEKGEEKKKLENEPLLIICDTHKIRRNSCISAKSYKVQVIVPDSKSEVESKRTSFWNAIISFLNLELLADIVYLNVVIGMSLAMISDATFVSLLPILLNRSGFDSDQTTFLITTHFIADLIGRIALSILLALIKFKARDIFLLGTIISIIFRVVYTMYDSFWWITSTLAILGFVRSLIQIPPALIFQEDYGHCFATAFSLSMVVNGWLTLTTGFLIASVKQYTGSDTIVVHLLTIFYLCCAISWIIELMSNKLKRK